ncbi:NUDIX hydrolase 6-like protein [Tanacetum coccineum]
MTETMEQYMSKTRADYGSGISRPIIDDKGHFELKGQFLKELRDNTFSGSDHEDANKHIEKVLEIVDLFHIPNITQDQEVILFYNGLEVPTRQIFDSKGAIPSKTVADAKVAIQEMAKYSQKWHNGTSRTTSTETSNGLDENNVKDLTTPKISHSRKKVKPSKKLTIPNLVDLSKEGDIEQQLRDSTRGTMQTLQIRASTDAAERGFESLPSSTEANPRDHVKSISTTVEADTNPIRRIGSPQYAKGSCGPQFLKAYLYGASHIDNSIARKEKDLGSFTLPCYINNVCFDNALADLGASISVMPLSTYLNLGLTHTKLTVELADRTMKYPKGIVEYVLGNNNALHNNIVPHDNTVLHDNNALHNNIVPHDNTVLHDNNVLHDNTVLHDNNVLHDNPHYKEIDKVGEVLIIWNPLCVVVMLCGDQSVPTLVIMEYLVKIRKKARNLELKRRHLRISVLTSYTPNMEMEPDIENMTMNEYLEHEAAKERQFIWEQDDDSEEDHKEDGDWDTFDIWDITIEDVERIRKFFNVPDEIDKIVQPLIPEPIHTTPLNDDYVAPATKSILDELLEEFRDDILNVTMVDEEANPTKDLEELERLLAKEPQSSFTEIHVHSVIINTELFIHTQLMSPLYGVFKTSNPCKVVRDIIFPGRLKHAKLILGYRDACEFRIRLIPC